MAYVDLQLAKRHLNVEQEFTDDDEYISGLIEAAEVVVSKDICMELDTLVEEGGKDIPAPLRQCILLMRFIVTMQDEGWTTEIYACVQGAGGDYIGIRFCGKGVQGIVPLSGFT